MKKINGTAGRIAVADLGSGEIRAAEIPEEYRRDFLGGKGLGLRYFYELCGPKLGEMDPLGEENLLCFFAGVMTGTGGVCSARFSGVTLSPLTGLMVHASCGGPFGIALKTAGYDGLIISGRAAEPVVLELGDPDDNPGRLRPAGRLSGLDCIETQDGLDLGKNDGALAIGPAGEHLVRYANIASGHRYLGRGGMGAVMGSKNLKAVVARGGAYKVELKDPGLFARVRKRSLKYVNRNGFTLSYRKYGTAANLRPGIKAGYLPVRNFSGRTDPRADVHSGEAMAERYKTKPSTCRPCSILCGHKGTYPDGETRQIPEYETVGLLGPNLENWDPDLLGRWNEAANRMGLDTITLGATLSWAMEAAEKGLRTSELAFGRGDNIEKTIEDIAHRRGEGDELAEGSRRLSRKYGGEEFAIHVKGMELAAYDPRAAWGQGLNYAVANRGGCHLSAFPISLEAVFNFIPPYTRRSKAEWVDYFEDVFAAVNSLQTCQFTSSAYVLEAFAAKNTPKPILKLVMYRFPRLTRIALDWSLYSGVYQSITGIRTTPGRFRQCGRRVHILERYMNTLRGVNAEQDTLPARFLQEGKTNHPDESVVPIASLVRRYYRLKGYDRRGIPKPAVLREMGIHPPGAQAAGLEATELKVQRLRPKRQCFAGMYCSVLLWFLGRAAAAASRYDQETAGEFSSLPEGFSFALQAGEDGPAMVLERDANGRGRYLGGAGYLLDHPVDLKIQIRTLAAAMLLFTFRESTATSQARDRMIADGPIPETCTVVRILNQVEILILPKMIAKLAVKRYRKPTRLAVKRLRIYGVALAGSTKGGRV